MFQNTWNTNMLLFSLKMLFKVEKSLFLCNISRTGNILKDFFWTKWRYLGENIIYATNLAKIDEFEEEIEI